MKKFVQSCMAFAMLFTVFQVPNRADDKADGNKDMRKNPGT
jgi:hypothetical protein